METRKFTIEQKKIYKLILNHMQCNVEHGEIVAISYYPEKLLEWKKSLLVGEYSDEDGVNMIGGKLNKVFQKGSELEFYNNEAPFNGETGLFDGTIFEEWISIDEPVETSNRFKFIS